MLQLPYVCLQNLQCCFAVLHSSLYQSALCFSHILGLLLLVMMVLVMTSAETASAIRNSSAFSAFMLLSLTKGVSMSLNAVVKRVLDLCSLHLYALMF